LYSPGCPFDRLPRTVISALPLILNSYLMLCIAILLQPEAFRDTCSVGEPTANVIVVGGLVILYDSSSSAVSFNCGHLADK
jgi:hypothetical protein